jgi:predicted esterase
MKKILMIIILVLAANIHLYSQSAGCHSVLPQGYDSTKKYPIVFVLPGMGGGYPSVPNAVNGRSFILSEVQGTESLAGGFDKTIERGEKAILMELARLKSTYSIDTNNVLLVGFSLGGDITFAVSLKNPRLINGAFIMSARSTFRAKPETLKGSSLRVYFTVGGADPRKKSVEQAKDFLFKAGISTAMDIMPKLSHTPPPDNLVLKGLNFLLK